MARNGLLPLSAAAFIFFVATALAQPPAETPPPPPRPMMGPGMHGGMGEGGWSPLMMGPGKHHGMMMAPGMIEAFAEGKLAFFKSWLGITEAQSGPWNAFAETVRAQAKSLAQSQQKRMPAPGGRPDAPPPLPQAVDERVQMLEECLAAIKKIKPSMDALYQALTPEQRQKADQVMRMH